MEPSKSFEKRFLECRRSDETGEEWVQAKDCAKCGNQKWKSCGNGWRKLYLFTRTELSFSNDPKKHLINREWRWVNVDDLIAPVPDWNNEDFAKEQILNDEMRNNQFESVRKEGIKSPLICDQYLNVGEGSEYIEGKYYILNGVHRRWHAVWLGIKQVWIQVDVWDLGG